MMLIYFYYVISHGTIFTFILLYFRYKVVVGEAVDSDNDALGWAAEDTWTDSSTSTAHCSWVWEELCTDVTFLRGVRWEGVGVYLWSDSQE